MFNEITNLFFIYFTCRFNDQLQALYCPNRKRWTKKNNHINAIKAHLTNTYKPTQYPCINDKKRLINESKCLNTD